MCGFAGVIVWDQNFRVSQATLEQMSAQVAHRGPDGHGLFLSPDSEIDPDRPQIALAHRRLAILDPDPRANQPFTDNQGRWIVFNGEIYNFRELRKELSQLKPDYAWRTTGDTEVLLVAYDVWGERCVRRLNGMFAFAVWDGPGQSLFLARDPMGQKPLYIATPPRSSDIGAVAFASELPVLRVLPWCCGDVDQISLAAYLRWGCIGNQSTIYKSVEKLAPGMWRRFSRGANRGQDFYFSPNDAAAEPVHTCGALRELVRGAVGRQLVSDVPVGCFLSGGVDSSVIAAAACAASGGSKLLTFSIGFDDPRYDETRYAAQVATHLGTEHHQFTVTANAIADLPEIARVCGEPFGDSSALPTHYLSRETRRHVKVALSGDGGDELFGGYDRYRAMRLDRYLRGLPPRLRRWLIALPAAGLPELHPKSAGSKLKRFLMTVDQAPARRYAAFMRIFDDATISQLSGRCLTLPPDDVEVKFNSLATDRDPVQAALAADRVTYLPDDLLTKVDRTSMLHALEVRSPFMDPELVRFAAGLSTDQLLKGGPKRMLREAFAQDLPAWVFQRKKMGFAVPVGEWFRGELRPMLRDNLFAAGSFASGHFNMQVVERLVEEHERRRIDHSQRLYALLMLELWWHTSRRSSL